jgi:cbb3-type cytochrome oxidase maturation protein
MSVIFLLIPLSILAATGFLFAFIWAVRNGQYEDTATPSMRVLLDEPARTVKPVTLTKNLETNEHELGNV